MKRAIAILGWFPVLGVMLGAAHEASARPSAPKVFCETYPDAPTCYGTNPDCTFCHDSAKAPPATNAYGASVKAALSSMAPSPWDDATFYTNLPAALASLEGDDADADGFANIDEIEEGSRPGDLASTPKAAECPASVEGLAYKLCTYDTVFAYTRVGRDVCGLAPTFDELEAFRALDEASQHDEIAKELAVCVKTDFWRGKDGVVWHLANRKVRPVSSLEEFAEFENDYDLFTYTQIDGHDVRDVLVAQYLVARSESTDAGGNPITVYAPIDAIEGQPLEAARRVGMLTTAWSLFYNTMFTALPRATAAQAYRSYLNLDIALSEGLEWGVANEPVDYDGAGVEKTECAQCHSTLDPLSYPFSRYNGIQAPLFTYDSQRMAKLANGMAKPDLANVPEAGVLSGNPFKIFLEWAQVAANSDAFYEAVVEDYWRIFVGTSPSPDQVDAYAEYVALWKGLESDPNHSVDTMLDNLVRTEAYGAP